MFQTFVILYSWADQDKEDQITWEKTKSKFVHGFCEANRHCHWHSFYENWNKEFYGVSSRGEDRNALHIQHNPRCIATICRFTVAYLFLEQLVFRKSFSSQTLVAQDQMKICNDIDETGCNGPPWEDDKYGYW
jgi:hypothetical protein